MDEETLRKEFEEWATKDIYKMRSNHVERSPHSGKYEYPTEELWKAWREATRCADRKAREECAEICERIGRNENSEDGRYIAEECSSAIQDTIKEE